MKFSNIIIIVTVIKYSTVIIKYSYITQVQRNNAEDALTFTVAYQIEKYVEIHRKKRNIQT